MAGLKEVNLEHEHVRVCRMIRAAGEEAGEGEEMGGEEVMKEGEKVEEEEEEVKTQVCIPPLDDEARGR